MKNPPATRSAINKQLIKTSGLFLVSAVLGIAFWLTTSTTGVAGPNMCDVCHKNVLTLTLACNSLEYRRHIDHGDSMGACNISRINRKTGDTAKTGSDLPR